MNIKARMLSKLNSLFKVPPHPLFDMHGSNEKSYAKWQFDKGGETISYYLGYTTAEEMFSGKTVLDVGCGVAGKTLYFAKFGIKYIYGVDMLKNYRQVAEAFAEELGLTDRFSFMLSDAAKLPFHDSTIDTIIMNDTMEHLDEPEQVLLECLRVLAAGGRIFLNFPPYNHPYGSHLHDAIALPWAHLFFSDKTMINVYKDAVRHLPKGGERIKFRKFECGDKVSYINKMTIRRFKKILKQLKLSPVYYKEVPLRNKLAFLAKIPFVKEGFVKMVVCVIQKSVIMQ